MARTDQFERLLQDERPSTFPASRRVVAESCIGGSPAVGGVCVEHGESACVMTLHAAS